MKIWKYGRAWHRQHKKSKQLRGQIQLLLECLVWNVPEYLPTYSLSWHTNYSLLSKHATPGQHRRDTAQGCVGVLYQTDLLSKTGLGISNIEIIPSRITESPTTAFILVRCMGKGGFGLYHGNISVDWPVHLGLRCFPEGSLIIYLSWDSGGGSPINISEFLSFPLQTNAGTSPSVHQDWHRP